MAYLMLSVCLSSRYVDKCKINLVCIYRNDNKQTLQAPPPPRVASLQSTWSFLTGILPSLPLPFLPLPPLQ